jgi:hypothetical protein
MHITDNTSQLGAQLANQQGLMAGSSGKIVFLLSRRSPVIGRCAGAVAVREVDPRDRSSTHRSGVGGRLVDTCAGQLGSQVARESDNTGTIVCRTLFASGTSETSGDGTRRSAYGGLSDIERT